MALAIDASTPAAVHSAATSVTAVTGAFSPPAGAVLVAFWAGDEDSGSTIATPTITDSLGTHLTWTLVSYSSHNDSSGTGQAAVWWAYTTSAQTNMTVTASNNTGSTTSRDAHLRVVVFTGADSVSPMGAQGKGGGGPVAGTATYTSTAAGSQGFIVFCDWTNSSTHPTLQSGCTEDSWTRVTGCTGWVVRQTSTSGSSGTSVTVGATAPSAQGRWVYVEVLPSGGSPVVSNLAALGVG